MKRALVFALALTILAAPASAANNGWPEDLAEVQRLVKSKFGEVPYDRVKVKRDGNLLDISIKLKNVPPKFRRLARQSAGDDDLFLATNFVESFEPNFDTFEFNVFPNAHFRDHYFGFVAFNFSKKIKRRAEITVTDGDKVHVQAVKKKQKYKKRSVHILSVEDTVDDEGLYLLYTEAGPWNLQTYFCAGCGDG